MKQVPVRVPYEPVEAPVASPNRRVLSKLRTRAKVLEAARALFTEHGYEASTIRDIAKRAGLSTGAVFANFQDKNDLFEAVLIEDYENVAQRMREAAVREGDSKTRILAVFTAAYEYYLENLPLLQASVSQSWLRPLGADQKGRSAVKVLLGIVADVLGEAARNGEIREDFDVRMVSETLWDCYLANYRRALFDGWALEALRQRLSNQIDLVLGGLRKS